MAGRTHSSTMRRLLQSWPAAGRRIALYFPPHLPPIFQLYFRACLEYSLCKLCVCSQPSLDDMETAFN